MIRLVLSFAVFLSGTVALFAAPDANQLIQQLQSEAPAQRDAALWQLVNLGDAALPLIKAAIASPDADLSARVAFAERMIYWSVSEDLFKKIGDVFLGFEQRQWHEREKIAFQISELAGKTAVPALSKILSQDKSEHVRRAAAIGLVRAGAEGLIAIEKANPDFLKIPANDPVLRLLIANGLMDEKKYDRAITEYKKALELKPDSEAAWYNLACAYSLTEKRDEAVEALKNAIRNGYNNVQWMRDDPDLENLQGFEPYERLMDSMPKEEIADE